MIKLLEANFKSGLKHFFEKDSMTTVAKNLTLADKQWDLQKNRMFTDPAMLKPLTHECVRIKKITIREESYDCKACFDMVDYSQSDIYHRTQIVECIAGCKQIGVYTSTTHPVHYGYFYTPSIHPIFTHPLTHP